jgi:ppGpp synthetase/RelA/SpoT-type nucleotidyltranferase
LTPEILIKIPAIPRLKTETSLVDKAFYRPDKSYKDPYTEIEDKVGVRFVVLLIDDIQLLCRLIESFNQWSYDKCRHFDDEKRENPLLFTYQSVYYIVRPSKPLSIGNVTIPIDTPCEKQIRTLLQHAHAELTHDAIYKIKRKVNPDAYSAPDVHRTVAKSMALIETTDGFFSDATKRLNHGPLEEFRIVERLDGIYESLTGLKPYNEKSSLLIWDEFEQFIDDSLIDSISSFITVRGEIPQLIKDRYAEHNLYQQSIVLFLYWMLAKKRRRFISNWPLSGQVIEMMANGLCISLSD